MAPLDLSALGAWTTPLVHLAIGGAFGALLERAGFGSARKLTAQFYLRDMSVLKVMFSAIVTAAVLITAATTFGYLDYDKLWINPTYLGPGIVGGLLFGVGFVVGGYCPGTALVSLVSLKLDGLLFTLGVLAGILLFGYTEPLIDPFWNGSYNLGKLTLFDWLGVSPATATLLAVLMALAFFLGGEWIERWMARRVASEQGATTQPAAERPLLRRRPELAIAAVLGALAFALPFAWGPLSAHRTAGVEARSERLRSERRIQIDPAELAELMKDRSLDVRVIDLRDEAAYNRFHLVDSVRLEPNHVRELTKNPSTAVQVLIGKDEALPSAAYKTLAAQGLENVYILAGGISSWIERFGPVTEREAVGESCPWSRPPKGEIALAGEHKVKRPGGAKKKAGGGCGG